MKHSICLICLEMEKLFLLFSLNLPMAFDLFEMKHRDDEKLEWAFGDVL